MHDNMTNSQIPDDIIDYLRKELRVLKQVVVYADQQKAALSGMELQRLEETCSRQEELGAQLQRLERERIDWLSKATGRSFKQAREISLDDLIAHANDSQKIELSALRGELKQQAAQLQDIHKVNRVLTERARRFVKETLRIITNDGMPLYNARV